MGHSLFPGMDHYSMDITFKYRTLCQYKIDYVAVQSYNAYTGQPITVVLAKALLNAHFNPKAAELKLEDYKAGDKLVPFKVIAEYKST